jgi:hypothetical protein
MWKPSFKWFRDHTVGREVTQNQKIKLSIYSTKIMRKKDKEFPKQVKHDGKNYVRRKMQNYEKTHNIII